MAGAQPQFEGLRVGWTMSSLGSIVADLTECVGRPARIRPNDDDETARGRTGENISAQVLARAGYDVEQSPTVPGPKNPDYRIEGSIFNAYSPDTAKARNIAGTIKGKVEDEQAFRHVIYLNDSDVDVDELRRQFQTWPIPRLEEVLAVKDDRVIRLFP